MAVKVPEIVVKQPDIAPAAPSAGASIARYKLRGAYWNGREYFPIDSILTFEIGKQPKSAVLVTDDEPVAEPEKAADTDED